MKRLQLITIFLLVSFNLGVGIKLSKRKDPTIQENMKNLFKSLFGTSFEQSFYYIYYTESDDLGSYVSNKEPTTTSCFEFLALY